MKKSEMICKEEDKIVSDLKAGDMFFFHGVCYLVIGEYYCCSSRSVVDIERGRVYNISVDAIVNPVKYVSFDLGGD